MSQDLMQGTTDVLERIREKGVHLWSEQGQLHYKAPKGALTHEELQRLRTAKAQIVALLEGAGRNKPIAPQLGPRRNGDRIPLTHSQVSHWKMYRLGEKRHLRQIASATRLLGPLSMEAFRASCSEIVKRHEALRTRIVVRNGGLEQEVSEPTECELQVDDLTTLSEEHRELEVQGAIANFILEPIEVAVDPLFGMKLLKLGETEHVMIVAMEHIISDGYSRRILVRDLLIAYAQALNGVPFSLPPVAVQFADYAVWQKRTARLWLQEHGAYWDWRLSSWRRLRFPEDARNDGDAARSGWGSIPIQIDSALKAELCDWCRVHGTTLAMTVFAIYSMLVLRWCDVTETVLRYQADGRVSPEMENTIGFFSSALYVGVNLVEGDGFIDVTKRVTEEYCRAYEHADFCYLETLDPQPGFIRNSAFNWQPHKSTLDVFDTDGADSTIVCEPMTFAHPMIKTLEWDGEPSIVLFDTDKEIVGNVHFPSDRFSVVTMERFGRNFFRMMHTLLRHPQSRVKDFVLL